MRALWISALCLAPLTPAEAGDRRAGVVLVRLDDGAEDAKACFGRLRRAIAGDYTEVSTLTREAFLKRAPDAEGNPLDWPKEKLDAVRLTPPGDGGTVDALVLVDCRPSAGTLDATLLATGNRVRITLQGLDAPRTAWVIHQIKAAVWLDFSP